VRAGTRAAAACLALLCAGATPALAKSRGPARFVPDPSAVIAAEIGFDRAAAERGQWTAFREKAAKDALMYVPQQVRAQDWLKGRRDPPATVRWQPHAAWVSCDGTIGVTTGAWQRPDGSVGYFTTVWRRDPKRGWQWILDHGDSLAVPRAAPEMLSGKVATCPARRFGGFDGTEGLGPPPGGRRPGSPAPEAAPPALPDGEGRAPDGTLGWKMTVAPDLSRTLVIRMRQGGEDAVVLTDMVEAPR
jgi:hypothetical protein